MSDIYNKYKSKEEQLRKQHKELMDKYGFVIHNVFPSSDEEILWSHHTHGLKENFNHMDLEIVLPIHPEMAGGLIHGMVEQIKNGESFEDKLVSDRVIQNYNVQLVKVNSENRELLRIVLPDANGNFPSDEDCEDVYKNQLDDILEGSLSTNN